MNTSTESNISYSPIGNMVFGTGLLSFLIAKIAVRITIVIFFASLAACTRESNMDRSTETNINGVILKDQLVSTSFRIVGRLAVFQIQNLDPSKTPDRVIVDYIDSSDRVITSDTLYPSTNENGTKFLEITIPEFQSPVTLAVRAPST